MKSLIFQNPFNCMLETIDFEVYTLLLLKPVQWYSGLVRGGTENKI